MAEYNYKTLIMTYKRLSKAYLSAEIEPGRQSLESYDCYRRAEKAHHPKVGLLEPLMVPDVHKHMIGNPDKFKAIYHRQN
jgi:hypothetical protein